MMHQLVHIFTTVALTATFGLTLACRSEDTPTPAASRHPVSEEVTLETPTGALHGTLLVPDASGTFPVALILAGSGPTDRNGNNPAGINSNYLTMIADSLAQHGIASLRYDKRGVAASRAAAIDESQLRFDHYVEEAVAWIAQLRQDERFIQLAVLGHSEGALIGMLAAQQATPTAYVSLAGAAQPVDSLILEQLRTQPEAIRQEAQTILAELRQGRTVATVSAGLHVLFRPSVQPYLISWIQYHPSEVMAKLSLPVLIVQGTTDLQVPEAEAQRLAAAQPAAELVIINGMNHVLKEAPADPTANIATYGNPTLPLAEGLMASVVTFLEQHFSQ